MQQAADGAPNDQDGSAASKKAAKQRELSNTKRAAQNRAAQVCWSLGALPAETFEPGR